MSRGSLHLSFGSRAAPGDHVVTLEGAVAERGNFRLGPIDLDLAPGERVAVTGRNGSGKTTLLALLLGELPLTAGTRTSRPDDRDRSSRPAPDRLRRRRDAARDVHRAHRPRPRGARTLLAKFNLGAEHVDRARRDALARRAHACQLAELQARGVNCLVLDEPTNHLDLEAIEELESALAAYEGTAVVVSHDRRFSSASRHEIHSPLAIVGSRSWPSPRRKPPRLAATSAAHSTASRRRASTCARGATAEAAAPGLPDLQDVQGPRDRAAPHSGP